MYEDDVAPKWPVNQEWTLVYDPDTNRQVAFLEGRIVLPVGAEIELYDESKIAHGTAVVKKVRLLSGNSVSPYQVCLDVEVEDRWWDAHPRE